MTAFIIPLFCLNCNWQGEYHIPRGRRFNSYKPALNSFMIGIGNEVLNPETFSHHSTPHGARKHFLTCRNCNVAMLSAAMPGIFSAAGLPV